MADPIIRLKRSSTPGKIPLTSDLQLGELAVNTHDGKAYLKKDVGGVETVVNLGGGYPGQTYYVTKTGLDTNDGQNISAAFATLKKALTVAVSGDTILISSGTFTEIFPLTIPQGVTVRGNGLRSTFIQPTSGTERNDAFLLNGESTIEDLALGNFYYNSSTDTGYGFKFAPNMVTTTRSPYVQRITVLNRGSTQTPTDPYGFDTVDNYPTAKVAGRGVLIDASVVQSTTLEPAMLFNECTFITPNQTALKMTNGARTEWVNCFTYFSSVGIEGISGSVGIASTANAQLKLSGITTSITSNYVVKYYQSGTPVAIGTVVSVEGDYITILGKGSGIFNSVGIGSTQDVRIFQSNGTTQVGTASTILWADYQKFGADMRSIGSATNFGTVGVRGDGKGVQLRLFGFNFGCVGSGKTFTQDPTLSLPENEAIQLNGGRVYFQSVDQAGNFRIGSIFRIDQETGLVSIASTSDITLTGTLTASHLEVIGVSTFYDPIRHYNSDFITDQTDYNLINTVANRVNFAGDATNIVIGSTSGVTTVRNYRFNLTGGQDSFTSSNGTLVVQGGVGISSNLNVGKDFKVSGVSTFVSPVRLDSSIRVAGVSTFVSDSMFNANLLASGIATVGNFRVTGVSTLTGDTNLTNNLNVGGITTTSTFRVTGISTLTGDTEFTNNIRVSGIGTIGNLRVTGFSTLTDSAQFGKDVFVSGITTLTTLKVTGISTLSGDVELGNNLRVAGVTTFSNSFMINSNLNVTGITTTSTFRVTGISTLSGDVRLDNNLNVAGVSTFVGIITGPNNGYVPSLSVSNINLPALSGTSDQYINLGNSSGTGLRIGFADNTSNGILQHLNTSGYLSLSGRDVRITNYDNTERVKVDSSGTKVTGNLQITGVTTTATFRVTGISTLSGDVELENNLRVAGVSTFQNTISHRSSLFITDQSTYRFIDTTTTTVTAFGDATTIGIGSTNATLTLRPTTIVGGNSTQNLYNTGTTTVNAFGAASTLNIGANSGTLTIGNPTVVGTQATQNLYNIVTTTVNAFGQATSIGIGSTNATLTARPSTIVGTNATQNVYNTVATTVNAFGAATTLNIGANSGTLTVGNPTVVGTQVTQNLYDTVATTVTAFGQATSIGIGSTNATLTARPSTIVGTNATQNVYNTIATSVNAFGAANNLLLGAISGFATVRNTVFSLPNASTVDINGNNPTISGSSTGTLTLFNTNLTTVNAFGEATTIGIGSTNATLTLRPITIVGGNTTQNLYNTGTTTVNAFGQATAIGIGSTNATLTLRPSTLIGQSATQNVYNTIANTVNAFGQASSINIGANSGTLTIGNPTVVGTQVTQDVFNSVATRVNAFGAAADLLIGANTGVTTIRNASVNLSNATSISATQSSFTVFNTNTTINAFGAASTFNIGANSGTLTIGNPTVVGTQVSQNLYNTVATRINVFGVATDLLIGATTGIATVRNLTFSLPNATSFAINGANPTISGTSTGTLTLFNTALTSINAFGAATAIVWGATTGIATVRNTTFSLPNATSFAINGANPTISGTSTGTLTLFNTALTSVNAFGDATNIVIGNSVGVTTIRHNLVVPAIDVDNVQVLGISTFFTDIIQPFGTTNLNELVVAGVSTLNGITNFSNDINSVNIYNSGTVNTPSLNVTGVSTIRGDLNVGGNLTVDGTVTSFNSSVLQVDDVNIELGVVSVITGLQGAIVSGANAVTLDPNIYTTTGLIPGQTITQTGGTGSIAAGTVRILSIVSSSVFTVDAVHLTTGDITFDVGGATDYTADQGGIILRGTTDKRIFYDRQQNTWSSTEDFNLVPSKSYKIGGQELLSSAQLSISNINITGVATLPILNVNNSSTFIATVGNLLGSNIYYTGISSFNQSYIAVGIVTNLKADYFTLTNNETLIATQNNSIIGPSTNKIAISTAGLNPEMTVYSTGTELLPNTTILSIDAPGIITITPSSINAAQTTTSTITVVDDPRAGVASISKLKAHIGILTNFDTVNANITGITTAQRLYVNTDIYTPGISSAETVTARVGLVTFLSGTNIQYTGVGTINTLRTNIGFVTNLIGTNLWYSGISTLPILNTNVGIVTYLTGTNIVYSGIGTIDVLRTNVGYVTTFYGRDIEVTGVTTTPAIRVNTGFVTTISGTRATYPDIDNTNLYNTGIASFTNLRTNVGIVTFLTGTNLSYSGIGTINDIRSNLINVGIATVGVLSATDAEITNVLNVLEIIANRIGTIALNSVDLNIVGTSTIANLNVQNVAITSAVGDNFQTTTIGAENLESDRIYSSGITSVSDFFANVGFVTALNVTNFFAGIGTIPLVDNTNIYTTGLGTITQLKSNVGLVTTLTSDYILSTNYIIGTGSTEASIGINTTVVGLPTSFILSLQINDFVYSPSGISSGTRIVGLGTNTITISQPSNNVGFVTETAFFSRDNLAGIASISTLKSNVGLVTYLSGTNVSYSGIGTVNTLYANVGFVTYLSNQNLSVSGVTTLVTVNASTLFLDNITNNNTLYTNVGFVTYLSGTNVAYSGIGTIITLYTNVGVVTNLTGTNVAYSGIGTINTLYTNSGFVTTLSGTNVSYTIGQLNSLFAVTGVVTTISGTRATYQDIDNVNIYSTGIGSFNNFRTNVGIVTFITGTNLNYSGLGTIPNLVGTNLSYLGISTLGKILATDITLTSITNTDIYASGIASITTLRANVGIITFVSGTNLNYSGVSTINTLRNVNLVSTGIATVNDIIGSDCVFTGISTFNAIKGTSLEINDLDIFGSNLLYAGIATFTQRLDSPNVSNFNFFNATNINITGVGTFPIIRSQDIHNTGVTTTGRLRVGVGGTILLADATSGIGSVGINTASPNSALHVYGDIQIRGNTLVGTISTTLTSNATAQVHTALARSDFRSVEYTVQTSIGNTHQITKILSIHDGVTCYNSEYSNISTGVDVASYDVVIDNSLPPGYIALRVTPVSNVGVTTVVVNFIANRI